jgi:hypothetical protein
MTHRNLLSAWPGSTVTPKVAADLGITDDASIEPGQQA